MFFLHQLKLAKNLPEGHSDKKKAQQAVTKEYSLSSQIERKWRKRFDLKIENPQHALNICNQICDMLGEKRLKRIVISSPEVHECAGAHYSQREIHFKWNYISLQTLIHELAHHFGHNGHGKAFCDTSNFLFGVCYTMVKGKQPKRAWNYA